MPHLEHLGLAVHDPEAVAALFRTLLGVAPYKHETVAREGVRTHFIAAGSAKLELLEALGPDSPVARFLDRRGEGIHHVAFEVEDVDAQLTHVRAHGFTPLSDAPRPGADGKRIFFLHPKETHGILVEFCQSTARLPEAERVPFGAGTLAAYRRGDPARPALVLLHGAAGSTALETDGLARHLEPHAHVLALDFAGHGLSDAFPEQAFSLDFFADHLPALLDHAGLDRAGVFGFSMGGYVALHAARRFPDRLGRLALHATHLGWDAADVAATHAYLDADAVARDPAFAARFEAAHADWRGLFTRLRAFVETLPAVRFAEADLAGLRRRVLVTAVDRDERVPLPRTLALHAALPASRLAILPGSRHALAALDPALLAPLLLHHFRLGASATP